MEILKYDIEIEDFEFRMYHRPRIDYKSWVNDIFNVKIGKTSKPGIT